MNHILVVGGASFDTLHLIDRTVESAGGVGPYIAMAVRRCGVQVSMSSCRPDPCPDYLQPVAELLTEYLGPTVSPDQMPRFENPIEREKQNISIGTLALRQRLCPRCFQQTYRSMTSFTWRKKVIFRSRYLLYRSAVSAARN